jgi:uncharacterized protein involved in oxidation of intracellular sulfur
VKVFLIGDAVSGAMADQKAPDGYHHLDRMIESAGTRCRRALRWTGMDARGVDDDHLTKDAHRPTPDELTDWTLWADKVITF